MIKLLKRIIAAPFVLFAAIVILLEDWLWDDLVRMAAEDELKGEFIEILS